MIKVFVKCKILSIEMFYAHARTGTRTRGYSNYAKLNLHSLKRAATEMEEDISMEQKSM